MMKEEIRTSGNAAEKLSDKCQLILYNDDFNTFDFVIQTLMDVCEHEAIQAEQCALVAHYNGKCDVYSGHPELLRDKKQVMTDLGLIVEIS
jgi:ATP-dependent Clp protease adaptor protein ClpS